MTEMLKSLENEGYLNRLLCESDKRLRRIVLTPKGEEKNLEASKQVRALENKLKSVLSKEESDMFFSIMSKISEVIEKEES